MLARVERVAWRVERGVEGGEGEGVETGVVGVTVAEGEHGEGGGGLER